MTIRPWWAEWSSGVPERPRPYRDEIASATIQGTAGAASVAGVAYLLARYGERLDGLGVAALVIYGAAMSIAFLASAVYHGARDPRTKAAFQSIDHCTIFLFIGGVYAPFALMPLRDHGGAWLLAMVWGLAVVGITLRLGHRRLYRRIAVPLYLAMGWLGLLWAVPLYETIGRASALLMLAGGLSYTGGVLLYGWHRLPFNNPAWHLCVVAGSACFYIAIATLVRDAAM